VDPVATAVLVAQLHRKLRRGHASVLASGRGAQVRDILERAVHTVSEQAKNASALVDEAHAASFDGSHPVTLQAKILRLELLNVKADQKENLAGSFFTARTAARRCIGSQVSCAARALGTSGTSAAASLSPEPTDGSRVALMRESVRASGNL
jgi:hypothetical protein